MHANEKVGMFHPMEATNEVCNLFDAHTITPTSSCCNYTSYSKLPIQDTMLEHKIHLLLARTEAELDPPHQERLKGLLYHYCDVISTGEDDLGVTEVTKHSINTQGSSPLHIPPRRLPFHKRQEVKKLLDNMLARGIIERSSSPWFFPIALVKKKDGSTWLCVDFRKLNMVTEKDAHLIPRLDETFDHLSGTAWSSTLDLASGYWQVKLKDSDKEKTAFSMSFGLYQFQVMPFVLCNAPATFQRLMEAVLAGLHWSICLVNLDDILIFNKTLEENFDKLRDVSYL